MVATALVVSDLHLADGNPAWENWGEAQQAAFEGMLVAAQPGGALATATVELIINGDCFDFLLAPPNLGDRMHADLNAAHAKWAAIAAAHGPWFAALRAFLRVPGHRATFIVGNHDLELLYPSIRARVRSAIGAAPGMVRFCLAQRYRPFPDVVIDHGCQYDPYNAIPGVWPAESAPATPADLETADARGLVGPIALTWGTRYCYQVFLSAKMRLPYLDEMVPSLGFTREWGLLSLLAPEVVAEALPRLAALVPEAVAVEVRVANASDSQALFAATLAIGQMFAQSVGHLPPEVTGTAALEAPLIMDALGTNHSVALKALLSIGPAGMRRTDSAVLAGARDYLERQPATRFYLLGHTHTEGRWPVGAHQAILNTGTWFPRYVLPHADEWTPEFVAWATRPADIPYPGRDGRRFTIAWLRSEPGAATVAELIAWHGASFTPVPDDAMARW
jgi:hypothetical protein